MRGLREPSLRAALAATLLVVLAAGCGSDDGPSAGEAPEELLGPRPGQLTCTDWKAGTEAERAGSIEQLTALAGANANPEDVGPNRTLSEDEAFETIDATCAHDAARGFLLYEIYNRAAAFSLEGA